MPKPKKDLQENPLPVEDAVPTAEPVPAPEGEAAPESFTPHTAEIRCMAMLRLVPDGPPVGSLDAGTTVTITGTKGRYATLENGLLVLADMLE